MIVLALAGCILRAAPPALPEDVVSTVSPPQFVEPAGELRDGVFHDVRGVSVPLVARWTPRVGVAAGAQRLAQVAPPSTVGGAGGEGLRIEVWADATQDGADPLAPRPREGCVWAFRDTGAYRAFGLPGERAVATCTPVADAPADAPGVLVWVGRCGDAVWHVELLAPPGRLGEGLDAAAPLVRDLRCDVAPP